MIGAGQMSRYLAEMAGRARLPGDGVRSPHGIQRGFAAGTARLLRTRPDDALIEFAPDAHAAILATRCVRPRGQVGCGSLSRSLSSVIG